MSLNPYETGFQVFKKQTGAVYDDFWATNIVKLKCVRGKQKSRRSYMILWFTTLDKLGK